MALTNSGAKNACLKMRFALSSFSACFLSSKNQVTLGKHIKKSVFISQSKDVYTNLALQKWINSNFDLKNHHILMLSQNDPCVIIGRNQNPWSETSISDLHNAPENKMSLAREEADGDALYLDNGNLNLAFFTPTEKFNASYNTELVARGVFRQFGCKVTVANKENLVVRNNLQISNKSCKLSSINAQDNMSLMVKSDKVNRMMALQKHDVHIKTQGTQTYPPPVMMNLCEDAPQISVSTLMKAVGWEFLRTNALTLRDGGMDLAHNQNGFQMINPTEYWFPGLEAIRDQYSSWEWCFGETPEFSITQKFMVPGVLVQRNTTDSAHLNVTLNVKKGRIADITMFIPQEWNSFGFSGEAKVIHELKGKKFSIQAFEDLEETLGHVLDDKDRFVTDCLKKVMKSA